MAEVKLSKLYNDKIHAPRDKQGNVYYIPKANGQNLTAEDKALLNNKEYMKMQQSCMNSPTNIRRIWMTTSKVVVEYYAGYKSHGQTSDLIKVRELDTNLRRIAEDILKYESLNVSQRTMSKLEKTYVRGRAFSAITSNYACNNIEEVYFDWGALLSEDARNILATLGIDSMQVIAKFFQENEQHSVAENKVAEKLLIGENVTELRSTFKRLKKIAMISKLDSIIGLVPSTAERFDISNVKAESSCWIDNPKIQSAIQQSNSEVWLTVINKTTNSNTSKEYFTIKSQQFLFDEKVLSVKIEAYVKKLQDQAIFERESEAAKEAAELNAPSAEGSVEALLESIASQHGEDFMKAVLKATVQATDKVVYSAALNSMTPVKRNHYLEIIKGTK